MLGIGISVIIMGALFMGLGFLFTFILPAEFDIVGYIFLPVGAAIIGTGIYVVARARRAAWLEENGVEGQAKLLEWWLIGKSGGEIEYFETFKFELEVTRPGQAPYTVKIRQQAHYNQYSILSKGMALPVKVHPEKPKQVLIDWDQFVGQAQAAAGKGQMKDRLKELEDAYHEGLITKDEYESKRADILKSL